MAGTRSLFASIGASAALVAAAALSLLTFSAVFAFGGWSESPAASVRHPALVFAGPAPSQSDRDGAPLRVASAKPLVLAEPQRRSQRTGAATPGGGVTNIRPGDQPVGRKPAPENQTHGLDPVVPRPVTTPRPPSAAAPSTGENVRKVGEDISSTVQGTGTALAQVTAPLLPPISTAVQQVFNAVAALLAQTSGAVGGAIDTLLPPKQ